MTTRNVLVRACGCEYDGRGWFQECPLHDAAEELLVVLECLTGYVESRIRKGDGTAPSEHAKMARAAITKVRGERA
jgi:hypothetical protein